MRVIPDNWQSWLITCCLGISVYLILSWMRLQQERRQRKNGGEKSIFTIMMDDYNRVLHLFLKKETKKGNQPPTPGLQKAESFKVRQRSNSGGSTPNMTPKRNRKNKKLSSSIADDDPTIAFEKSLDSPVENETIRPSLRHSPSLQNFFSGNKKEYLTPLPISSASPLPQEYDEANEMECNFLRKSKVNARGHPEYIDVLSKTYFAIPTMIRKVFAPLNWFFGFRPICYIRDFVVDVMMSIRFRMVIKNVASNEDVLKNPHISKQMDQDEDPKKYKKAMKIITKMAARQNTVALRIFYVILSSIFRKLFSIVHIDKHGLKYFHDFVKQYDKEVGVVFLPTHKSHIDYLVLSYIAAFYDIPMPVIAAGDNLNFPIVGDLFRYSGAFFMRRALGNDYLYRAILEGYLEEVLKSGSILEFFIEGGRSRDGSILPPKYGLLNVILDAVKSKRLHDVILVPIAVDYEHCPDINSYIKYMMGGKKTKESLTKLLKSAYSILSTNCGNAYVTFGTPMSLQEILQRMEKEDYALDARSEVKYVGAHVCQAMRDNSVVTDSVLVASALLTYPSDIWISESELSIKIDSIRSWLRRCNAFEGCSQWPTSSLRHFAHLFPDIVEIRDKEYRINGGVHQQLTLLYYRNGLLHHFLTEATVLHVFTAIQQSTSSASLSLLDVIPSLDLICRLVSPSIPFNSTNSVPAAEETIAHGYLVLDEDVLSIPKQHKPYVQFCVSLIAPIIDSLWLVSSLLKHILSNENKEIDLSLFIIKCLEVTNQYVEAGDMFYACTVNTQMIRNSIDGFVNIKVLKKRREGSDYFISVMEEYNKEKLDALEDELYSKRINIATLPKVSIVEQSERDTIDDVNTLRVDVKRKTK